MMIIQEHIVNLSDSLKEILDSELKAGNKIVETSKGWPEKETVIVFLGHPFFNEYKRPNVEFREINDPHWWKSEYFDKSSKHVLACKYD
jgi:hypothetical protein